MAATIAVAIGRDTRGNQKMETQGTRLGATQSEGRAQTFKTFTVCVVNADGSGWVQVERIAGDRRVVIHRAEFGPEGAAQEFVVNILPWGSGADVKGEVAEESAYTQSMREFDRKSNGGQW